MLRGPCGPRLLPVSLCGGRVNISPAFLLLAAWLLYSDRQGVMVPALLACALHEAGHVLAIHWAGSAIKEFNITAVGAELVLLRQLSYGRELLTAAAGPGTNLLLAALTGPRWPLFTGLNLALAVFNLLPLEPLDGGRMLRCCLSLTLGPGGADRAGRLLSRAAACLLLLLGLWAALRGGNPTLLLAALWLCAAATGDFREKWGKRVVSRG